MNESTPAVDAGHEKFLTLGMWLGYTRYGEVPKYACSGDGRLDAAVFYYHQLD